MLPRRIKQPKTRQSDRIRCPGHLQFVRSRHCLAPGCLLTPTVAHHVRLEQGGGTSLKPGDDRTVALCAEVHHLTGGEYSVHGANGERGFERIYGIDLLAKAAEFAKASDPLKRYLARKRAA